MRTRTILSAFAFLIMAASCTHTERRDVPYSESKANFSLEIKEKVNVLDYFPLQAGNTWIYKNMYKSEIVATGKIITITWTSEITVAAHYAVPEGIVVVRI